VKVDPYSNREWSDSNGAEVSFGTPEVTDMSDEEEYEFDLGLPEEDEDLSEPQAAVAALSQALLVAWDDLEEGVQQVEKSPLVESVREVFKLFTESHPVLIGNDLTSEAKQFGPELHGFMEVTKMLHVIMDTPEFSCAQWGAAYARVEEASGIPAAVMDAFSMGFDVEGGFEILGLKSMFDKDDNLRVEAWGAAHQLAELGILDSAHLSHLPRPHKRYFISSDESEEGTNAQRGD